MRRNNGHFFVSKRLEVHMVEKNACNKTHATKWHVCSNA
jgi:hypothetical protein